MADACRALSCWMTLFPAIKATKQGESVSATSPFAAALCLAFSQLAFSPIESLYAADTTSTFNCRCLIDAHALSNTLRWDGTIEDLKSWSNKQTTVHGEQTTNRKILFSILQEHRGRGRLCGFCLQYKQNVLLSKIISIKKCRDLQ